MLGQLGARGYRDKRFKWELAVGGLQLMRNCVESIGAASVADVAARAAEMLPGIEVGYSLLFFFF